MKNNKTGILRYLLSGRDGRKSRLHDARGESISFARLSKNGPKALASWVSLKLLKKRYPRPWISYDACKEIENRFRNKKWSALEFGSGMSTLWFAAHATRISSVEHHPEWFEMIKPKLPGKVDYKLEEKPEDYIKFKKDSVEQFDFILIDGPLRAECFRNHMHLVKPNGMIYLDNSDANSSSDEPGEIDLAVKLMEEFAASKGATIERFTDFSPASLFVTSGLMVTLTE
jgi:hypothetical protein